MRQYQQIKAKYPDTIVLFRMGDFFETFEEDARITSKVLGITLTRRANGAAADVPLAGFPHHALDTYLPKLVKAGYRVAVCEQLEDPRFARGIVRRDVIEVVTPGVALSDRLLENKQNNYLASLYIKDSLVGLAFADVSTGEFSLTELRLHDLKEQIENIAPSEILIPKRDKEKIPELLANVQGRFIFTKLDDWIFSHDYCYELLISHFKTQSLKGFGLEDVTVGIIAAGAVMNYLQETQRVALSHMRRLTRYNTADYIILDPATKRNLEITASLAEGSREGTLISILDRTQTPMGGRLFKKWIARPLKKVEMIQKRLDSVQELVDNSLMRSALAAEFKDIGDMERLISKISISRPVWAGKANPRDLIALKLTLRKIPRLKEILREVNADALVKLRDGLEPLQPVVEKIENAIVDDPPTQVSDGGVIRKGFSKELDEIRAIAHSSKKWVANLQQKERERTGISSLKVDYNSVFGYYIEVTKPHLSKVPADYIRKQTLVNAERFVTPELKIYEEKILNAEEKIAAVETELFNEIRTAVAEEAEHIQRNAQFIAMLDCLASLADVAVEYNYTRPEVDESDTIEIKDGRHPVVERLLLPGEKFIPNDAVVDNRENQILIITGPNMSGKSVYLRQVALIVLLAQMGSFVPARKAHIGIVDRIFTRVGASDNIAQGESTFLVEMHEAANILNNATPKSLILLDEVGRGTSTFDGISIAWALTEYLHGNPQVAAKTLFATHYHELNELAEIFPRIKNYKVEVKEWEDRVIFLRKVTPGFADHSYGIQVAQMAGLPGEVTERAKEILRNLEGKALTPHEMSGEGKDEPREKERTSPSPRRRTSESVQITLFEMPDDKLREEIKKLDLDKLTPLEALIKLGELKKMSEK